MTISRDTQNPNLLAGFDLPTTSAAEATSTLDKFRNEHANRPKQARGVASTTTNALWWSGIKKHQIVWPCHYTGAKDAKEKGSLKATYFGIEYKGPPIGGAKVKVAWSDLAKVEVGHTQQRHGKQRSAFGFGPVGIAVVGATAAHNRRAAKLDNVHVITITNRKGEQAHFVAPKLHSWSLTELQSIASLVEKANRATAVSTNPAGSGPHEVKRETEEAVERLRYSSEIDSQLDALKAATQKAQPLPSTPSPSPRVSTPAPPPPGTPAGWLEDPAKRFEHRYWDGGKWTEHVARNGEQTIDFL